MADNIKLIEENVEVTLDENGAPGSILALEHKTFVKQMLNQLGKYSGLYFQAKKTGSGTYPTGTFSWENNAMNAGGTFVVRVSKLTSDLNDVGYVLGLISLNSLVHYKDRVGRSCLYRFLSFEINDSSPSNVFYNISLENIPGNINYTFQNTENEMACLSFYINPATASAGVNTATGDGINNTDPNNPVWTFPNADEVDPGVTHIIPTITEVNQITTNQNTINAIISSYARRKAVINIVNNTVAPPTEVSGNRYILDFTGATNANWDGANPGDIVEFNGTIWTHETPVEGWIAYLDTPNKDALFVDDGVPAWQIRNTLDTNAIHTDVSNEFNVLTEELVFNDNDRYIIESAGNSFAKRFIKGLTIKNALSGGVKYYEFACSDETTPLFASIVYTTTILRPFASFQRIDFGVLNNVSGQDIILDVTKNGATIFSTRPRIEVGKKETVTAVVQQVLTGLISFAVGDTMQVVLIQVGTGLTPGKNLKAQIKFT